MHKSNRIRVSANFILCQIACVVMSLVSIIFIWAKFSGKDVKDVSEFYLFMIISLVALAYSFTLPTIYFDADCVYIKKFNRTEIAIPLSKIAAIKSKSFSYYRGFTSYWIEYLDAQQIIKLRFRIKDSSVGFNKFINTVKLA